MTRDVIEFQCSNGHFIEEVQVIERCPAVVQGEPCNGHLKRVGKGSRPRKATTS